MMRRIYALILAVLCLTPALLAKAEPAAQKAGAAIDEFILSQMELGQIPGLSLGIVEDGQITYLKGYGVLEKGGAPVTPDTPFEVGSVGKSFTALCIRKLAIEGKVDYDAPVTDYIPWFTLQDEKAASLIRIKDLLRHQSGLSTVDGNAAWTYNENLTIEQAVRNMRGISPNREAGTTEEYSNLNFILLGLVVEKASGMSYADYVTLNVFAPLNMDGSFPSRLDMGNAVPAKGHYTPYGLLLPNFQQVPKAQVPAGYQVSSARDMTRYAALLLNNGYDGGVSVIPGNELAQPSPDIKPTLADKRYNAYWTLESGLVPGNGYHGHAGASSGYTSVLLINNMRRRAIVVLANCRNTSAVPEISAQTIGNQIASILNTGKVPATAKYGHPGLPASLAALLAALLLPLLRLLLTKRFKNALARGGWRKSFALITFALVDVLAPLGLLIGMPLFYGNTWPYFLASGMEIPLPARIASILLLGTGILKTGLLMKKRFKSMAVE